jgi:hypothetical protein
MVVPTALLLLAPFRLGCIPPSFHRRRVDIAVLFLVVVVVVVVVVIVVIVLLFCGMLPVEPWRATYISNLQVKETKRQEGKE